MPKKKNNAVLIILAILGGLLLCCGLPMGVVGYYGFKGFKGGMQMVGCFANVSMMKEALHKYAADHGGKLPPAATWQSDLGKYLVRDKDMDGAPMKFWQDGGEWACEDAGVKTGFMFNEALSEKSLTDVMKSNPDAVAIFETKTVKFNQAGPYTKLPFAESPKFMGEFTDEHRGWFIIDAQGTHVYIINKSGNREPFNMNSKSESGVNWKIDSNSSND